MRHMQEGKVSMSVCVCVCVCSVCVCVCCVCVVCVCVCLCVEVAWPIVTVVCVCSVCVCVCRSGLAHCPRATWTGAHHNTLIDSNILVTSESL